MPITATHLTDGTATGTSVNTASISPPANNLILLTVAVNAGSPPNVATATGASITWVQVLTYVRTGTNNKRVTVLRALSSSPGSGVINIDFGGESQTAYWSIDQFSGINTSGTNGSGAIVQTASQNADFSVSPSTVTLSAFSNSGNMAYGGIQGNVSNIVVGSGFTVLASRTEASNNFQTEYKLNDNTVDWTFTTAATTGVEFGVEIKVAGSAAFAFFM